MHSWRDRMWIDGCRGLAAGVRSASENRHRPFQQSLLSVWLLWAVEARATVGLGAIGGFLYYFVVKALNADIDEKYRKTRTIQFLCGIFTVAIALTIHTWVATMAWFTTYLGPRIRAEAALAAVTAYQDDMLPAILPMYVPMLLVFWYPFCDAACRKNALSKVDACFPSGHMEPSAGCSTGYCAGNADAGGYMDVRDEPEQHEQCYHDLVHRGCGL